MTDDRHQTTLHALRWPLDVLFIVLEFCGGMGYTGCNYITSGAC
jgi:predicted methyltransferase